MRDLRLLDAARVADPRTRWAGDANHGAFQFPSLTGGPAIRVVASSGYGWDHVSVTVAAKRCPTWEEMTQVRRLFFRDNEAVMQYHAPIADYVTGENGTGHPFCLHLWRPYDPRVGALPVPPKWMVGGMSREEADRQAEASEAMGLGPKRSGAWEPDPPEATTLSEREEFEKWAADNVGQPSFAGKYVRDGRWSYNHNFIEMCWRCWLARAVLIP